MMASQADFDAIERYERMSAEEIDAELRAHSIDPQPTVKAVLALVDAKLKELRRGKRRQTK